MEDTASSVTTVQSVPDEIKGWSWGGFLWSWIWAIGNDTWIGLLALILPWPVMQIVLGIKGREWAWKNKKWTSVDDFKRVQRSWAKWWLIIMLPLMFLSFIAIFASAVLVALNPAAQIEKANQMKINQQVEQVIESYSEE